MKIDKELISFLRGEKFSNSLILDIDRDKYPALSRENLVSSLVKGKSVVHVGCSDHIPLITEKISNNKWLHKLITENSGKVIGIDINHESIEFLKNKLGYSNVIQGDIQGEIINELIRSEWDLVVFGEIIEHLDNPGEFLTDFRMKYGKNVKEFIITVPSILNKKNIRNLRKFREEINSDHRFWFTPYTILKIISTAGWHPETIVFANPISRRFTGNLINKIKKIAGIPIKYHFWDFSTMVITGRINNF